MASISDSIQLTIEEKIMPTIHESLWELDPIYPMIVRSSAGVQRNRGLGRGWNVLKTWVTGVAGGAKFASPVGGNVVSGPNQFNVYDTPQAFQGLDETTAPAFLQTTLQLIEHRGNFFLPHQILRADKLTSSIGSVVAQNLKAVGDLLAQQEAAMFYSTDSTTYALGDLGDTSANVANHSSDTSVIVVDFSGSNASGRVHRFRPGMLVDFYDSTGATKRNSGFTIGVDNVDPKNSKVSFRRIDGGTFQVSTTLNGGITYAGAGGDNDVVVIKDSVGVAPHSLESWIADGTTVSSFFGITVNSENYSQFLSYVPSSIGAALTNTTLNRHFAAFYEYFPGRKLDTAITTMGVIIGFLDSLDGFVSGSNAQDGRFRYGLQGEALKVEAGWDYFHYRFASKPVDIYTSTYMQTGRFIAGCIKGGNIVRYVPPPLPNARSDPRFGAEVEFIAGLGGTGGYQGIFKHAHNASGATTDFVEAPFVRQWNIMPQQPNWLKLTGITEILG